MIALARIADRGPLTAAVLAAGLLLAALWIPALIFAGGGAAFIVVTVGPLSMLMLVASAAVVAFVALRHGEWSAMQVSGVCLGLLLVLSLILYGSALQVPLIAVLFWLPAVLAAFVLARTVRLDLAVIAIIVCGLLAVSGFFLIAGDVSDLMQAQLSAAISDSARDAGSGMSLSTEQQESLVDSISQALPGAFGVSVMCIALGALFVARSWQAALVNPGGFQKEFHALSLGRTVSLVGIVVIFFASWLEGPWSIAISMVVIFGLFLQGLAVAHAVIKQRSMHRYWLHGLYVLILLLPHSLLLLAALGLVDTVFSIRGKAAEASESE